MEYTVKYSQSYFPSFSKYGYEVTFLDNVSISNIEATLKDYADGNYDIIIAQGYE